MMKNRFRALALFLCVCQMICLWGCAPASTGNETTAPTQPETVESEPVETTGPTAPAEEVSKVIPWGQGGSIAQQAVDNGTMILCFMSGEGTEIKGGSSESAFGDTKWGDSTLIAFPDGQLMLIDGGMSDYAPLLVENLQALGVTKIDHVVLSHRHDDHYGGLLCIGGVLESFEIGTIYTSGAYNGNSSDPMKLEGKARELDIPHQILRQGDVMDFGGVTMEVLWPQPEVIGTYDDTTEGMNNGSLTLRFDYGEVSALFTGDLYVSGEQALLNAVGEEKLDVDILKIPHHGRSTSSSRSFAEAVTPEIAVATGAIIMEPSVYSVYARLGTRVFMDVYDGYVMVSTDGTGMSWEASRVRDVEVYDKLDAAFEIDREK